MFTAVCGSPRGSDRGGASSASLQPRIIPPSVGGVPLQCTAPELASSDERTVKNPGVDIPVGVKSPRDRGRSEIEETRLFSSCLDAMPCKNSPDIPPPTGRTGWPRRAAAHREDRPVPSGWPTFWGAATPRGGVPSGLRRRWWRGRANSTRKNNEVGGGGVVDVQDSQ
ncbi:hypothetical protein VTN02DRAFT_6711 [Thermoascus thermophilus]